MTKKRREVILTNRISRLATYSLNGYEQKVLLDGKDENSPVMLFLHGGPGMPLPFCGGSRGMFPDFTDHFIMVYWDQLGCGMNDYYIDDTFTIDTFVDMTVDLVKELKKEFADNQLILLGASWGSVLAAKTAVKVPELVDNVLTYGQISSRLFFNKEVYEALINANMSPKAKKRLLALQEAKAHTPGDVKNIAALIRKYTEGYQAKSRSKLPVGAIIIGLLTSSDYSLKNVIAIVKNGFMKNRSIWNELLQIDLIEDIKSIRIPYRILQGSTDIVTSIKAVSLLVSESNNDCLSLRIIENSGHIPSAVAMNEILSEIVKLINK